MEAGFLTPVLRERVVAVLCRFLGPPYMPPSRAPELWAFIAQVAWPDPSPEIEGLRERVKAGRELLRGQTLEHCVALWDTFRALRDAFDSTTRRWASEGTPVTVPQGETAANLGSYAVLSGEAVYRSALSSQAIASQLAARTGYVAHRLALVSFTDIFHAVVDQATDAELESLIARSAKGSVERDDLDISGFVHHPRFGFGVIDESIGDGLLVTFADGQRELRGNEAAWTDTRGRVALRRRIEDLGGPKARPVVSLELFFEGNTDQGSIGCNLSPPSPSLSVFYRVLADIRARPDVADVVVQIVDGMGPDDWPFSDRIYVVTTATDQEVHEWAAVLRPDPSSPDQYPGWFGAESPPPGAPVVPPGHRVVYLFWD